MTQEKNNIIEINNKHDFIEIIKKNKIILIDFYADWCGPCKRILPKIEKLASNLKDIDFYKMNIENDEFNDIVNKVLQIKCLPTFCIFKKHKCLGKLESSDEKELINFINNVYKNLDKN